MEGYQKFEESSRGKWQWQTNLDLCCKSEENRWECYSLAENYLIEKAYYEQQKEIDLGNYVISIQHMIEKKKENPRIQRPVRRVLWANEMRETVRSERYFDTELPKPVNKMFGSLDHFIHFFSRRSPEILEFTKKFNRFEESNDLDELNKAICSQIVGCFRQEFERTELKSAQEETIELIQKEKKDQEKKSIQKLISLFEKKFSSFEEFYGEILRAYTMSSPLYKNLNRYLREENWTELENLLPYAFCLCKSFKLQEKKQRTLEVQGLQKKILTLFRGTALDELALKYYDPLEIKYFSWNAVTSTSKKLKVAEEFMYGNTELKNKKYPVLFIIEVPMNDDTQKLNNKWIDLHQYSAVPSEEEVILAPGTVFELKDFTSDEKKKTIRIKLKSESHSLMSNGFIMSKTLMNEMISDKEIKIMCLEGEELNEAFKAISGNRLIEKIEFCLCQFDNQSVEEMIRALATMNRIEEILFVSCSIQIDKEKLKKELKDLLKLKVKKLEFHGTNNFYNILGNGIYNLGDRWRGFQELETISMQTMQISDEGVKDLASHGLKYLTQLKSLNLNFSGCLQITDEKIKNLASEGLKYLIELTSLELNFSKCSEITDEGIKNLCRQGLNHLTHLTSLDLNFSGSSQITDQGVKNLCITDDAESDRSGQGLQYLTQLTSLNLNFSGCSKITDEGMDTLQEFHHLTQLISLNLNFSGRSKITDNGLKNLYSKGLKNLTQLRHLNLNLSECSIIRDEGIYHLCLQGLQHLNQLKSLNLNFSRCLNITDDGMSNLCLEGLKHLTQLTFLDLNFSGRSKITNQGINNLCSDGLIHLEKLASLHLNFSGCLKLTDEGVKTLCRQGLNHLTKLTSLNLNFSGCLQITDEGVDSLCRTDERVNSLCRIDEGENNLCSQGSTFLIQLRSFNLDLSWCSNITDAGMNKLGFKGLKHLTQLVSLGLNFRCCRKITDEGLDNLGFEALKNLTQLESLSLNFGGLLGISKKGMKNLSFTVLSYLSELESLSLNFQECSQITDEDVKELSPPEINRLEKLKYLNLEFENCPKVLKPNNLEIKSYKQILNAKAPLKLFSQRILDSLPQFIPRQSDEISSSTHDLGDWCALPEFVETSQKLISNQNTLNELEIIDQAKKLKPTDRSENFETAIQKMFPNLENFNSMILQAIKDSQITNGNVELKSFFMSKTLNLDFKKYGDRTDEGVKNLCLQELKYLTQLTSLHLDFFSCSQITDAGVNILGSQGLKHLTQLKSLNLNFSECLNLTDEGVNYLSLQGLKHLTQLTFLHLNFAGCTKITDTGINIFCSQGLKYLTQLTTLKLNFAMCWRITDEGMNKVGLQIIKSLNQMQELELNFEGCPNITDFTRLNILRALRSFGFTILN